MERKKKQTVIERACKSVPGFAEMYNKLERKVILGGLSKSTLYNYGRSIAKVGLYFGKIPLELEDDQLEDYLLMLKDKVNPSESYFKHTVYGLRFLFRLFGREDRAIKLPIMRRRKKLPIVLSQEECRILFKTPRLLKHRVMLSLIYSAGLRMSELKNLRLEDIDRHRMRIHIRQGKFYKDRYVPLSKLILRGLDKYIEAVQPKKWLFNGYESGAPISSRGIQWTMREAVKKSGIQKHAVVHTLRHSYATHLLEMGVDIVTIKNLLGHERIETTMLYLHVARLEPRAAFSPLDKLYPVQ